MGAGRAPPPARAPRRLSPDRAVEAPRHPAWGGKDWRRVENIEVHSKETPRQPPFPESHSYYWYDRDMFERIVDRFLSGVAPGGVQSVKELDHAA